MALTQYERVHFYSSNNNTRLYGNSEKALNCRNKQKVHIQIADA